MLSTRDFPTFHFSPSAAGASAGLLSLAEGGIVLLEDENASAPQVHFVVRLGGGESQAIDERRFSEETERCDVQELRFAVA